MFALGWGAGHLLQNISELTCIPGLLRKQGEEVDSVPLSSADDYTALFLEVRNIHSHIRSVDHVVLQFLFISRFINHGNAVHIERISAHAFSQIWSEPSFPCVHFT